MPLDRKYLRNVLWRGLVASAVIFAFPLVADTAAQSHESGYVLLHGGEEILDTQTRLVWRRCAAGMAFVQNRCIGKAYIGGGSDAPPPNSVRRTAWRLPTQVALMTLVVRENPQRLNEIAVVDVAAFPDTPRERFLGEITGGGSDRYVDFFSGRSGMSRPLFRYAIRHVRDGSHLRKSGDEKWN